MVTIKHPGWVFTVTARRIQWFVVPPTIALSALSGMVWQQAQWTITVTGAICGVIGFLVALIAALRARLVLGPYDIIVVPPLGRSTSLDRQSIVGVEYAYMAFASRPILALHLTGGQLVRLEMVPEHRANAVLENIELPVS